MAMLWKCLWLWWPQWTTILVFTLELVVISWALEYARVCPRWSFVICTDSLSGMQAIDQCPAKHLVVSSIKDAVFTLGKSHCSITVLTLGHISISGNEHVGQLVKQASTSWTLEIGLQKWDIWWELNHKILGLLNSEWAYLNIPNLHRAFYTFHGLVEVIPEGLLSGLCCSLLTAYWPCLINTWSPLLRGPTKVPLCFIDSGAHSTTLSTFRFLAALL